MKLAEQRLVEQETTKSYVGGHGDALFAARLAELALGAASPLLLEQRADATQTPGGTGACAWPATSSPIACPAAASG